MVRATQGAIKSGKAVAVATCPAAAGFWLLGQQFSVITEQDWIALGSPEIERRRLRQRACGSVQIAGERHIILAAEEVARETQLSLASILTRREFEIAGEIALGSSNKDIARLLGISHLTVREYVRRICHKLGVRSRSAVAGRIGSRTEKSWSEWSPHGAPGKLA
jgi:DNA-binding CsgD family transcriptional regulator